MANRKNPDQTANSSESDLGLDCLYRLLAGNWCPLPTISTTD